MIMKISIDEAIRLANDRIWMADVDPRNFRYLGTCQNSLGDISVALVVNPTYVESQKRLEFEPSSARVLNVGNSKKTVIIGIGHEAENSSTVDIHQAIAKPGDAKFLAELKERAPVLASLGERLLSEVRRDNPSNDLNSKESGKYVEGPDNYWTVKIQPRDQSLSITVRGRPQDFEAHGNIEIKGDRPGYSRFKIYKENQLNAGIQMIRQARRKQLY
jgi:hypothetical protein